MVKVNTYPGYALQTTANGEPVNALEHDGLERGEQIVMICAKHGPFAVLAGDGCPCPMCPVRGIDIGKCIEQFYDAPHEHQDALQGLGATFDWELEIAIKCLESFELSPGEIEYVHTEDDMGELVQAEIMRFKGTPHPAYGLSVSFLGPGNPCEKFSIFVDEGNGLVPLEFPSETLTPAAPDGERIS